MLTFPPSDRRGNFHSRNLFHRPMNGPTPSSPPPQSAPYRDTRTREESERERTHSSQPQRRRSATSALDHILAVGGVIDALHAAKLKHQNKISSEQTVYRRENTHYILCDLRNDVSKRRERSSRNRKRCIRPRIERMLVRSRNSNSSHIYQMSRH